MTTSKMPKGTERTFVALVGCAHLRRSTTYGEIAPLVGLIPMGMNAPLNYIMDWCSDRGYPHLSALVVSKETGMPGPGYQPNGHLLTLTEFEAIKARVFDFDWRGVTFP